MNGTCRPMFVSLEDDPKPLQALPVSAYFDWTWLARKFPMARYHDWEAERVAAPSTPEAQRGDRLHVDPTGRIVTNATVVMGFGSEGQPHYSCAPGYETARTFVGSFSFRGHTCPPGRGNIAPPHSVRSAVEAQVDAHDVFVAYWIRHQPAKWSDKMTGGGLPPRLVEELPPLNPLHYAAARAWVASATTGGRGDRRYGAVQWRSQGKYDNVDWCAQVMSGAVSALPGLGPKPATAVPGPRSRMVLVADVPSPANKCGIWDLTTHEIQKTHAGITSAAKHFRDAGFAKYDDTHWDLDAGIVALREAVVAAEATWYFTCTHLGANDDRTDRAVKICHKCYFVSGWILEIALMRIHAGRPIMYR